MPYAVDSFDEIDRAIETGMALQRISNHISFLYSEYVPNFARDLKAHPLDARSEIQYARKRAYEDMLKVREIASQYPNSQIIQDYISDIAKKVNALLKKTTDEAIERKAGTIAA